jgi:hypothetical protein
MLNIKFPYTVRRSLCPSLTIQLEQNTSRMHKDSPKNVGILRNRYQFVVGETRRKHGLENESLYLNNIIKMNYESNVRTWTVFSWLRIFPSFGHF